MNYSSRSPYTPKVDAKSAAIQLLSRRDHGEYELRQKMLNKGYPLADIDNALHFCIEHRYLDDERFAKSQVRQHIYKGHGKRRILQDLSLKKVSESIVLRALEEESVDWFELAKETADKRFKGQKSTDAKEYAKQVRFLQYRGFDFDEIKYAIDCLGSIQH
ncbi:recombinase RecX [Vibrio sp. qd031]|uniref:recombination regulator RecX n=1 Tax=Vibrio sp. qd031 TaxID=1603038 RepID=UPI000A0F7346|nr:recombination regulator RecX [Vibrio sp. qd031]ORT52158.1 recombinase RecX [Vibrio sp. qd031]